MVVFAICGADHIAGKWKILAHIYLVDFDPSTQKKNDSGVIFLAKKTRYLYLSYKL